MDLEKVGFGIMIGCLLTFRTLIWLMDDILILLVDDGMIRGGRQDDTAVGVCLLPSPSGVHRSQLRSFARSLVRSFARSLVRSFVRSFVVRSGMAFVDSKLCGKGKYRVQGRDL